MSALARTWVQGGRERLAAGSAVGLDLGRARPMSEGNRAIIHSSFEITSMSVSARRFEPGFILVLVILALSPHLGCQSGDPEPPTPLKPGAEPAKAVLKNEIPAGSLEAVVKAHYMGLGYMEQYEYAKASESFREVVRLAPGWIPGAVNLSIALLNDTGVKVEKAKQAGGGEAPSNFDEAIVLLDGVLEREPANAHAHFCKGVILEQQGSLAEAHRHFARVTEVDATDPAAWYWSASTLTDPDDPSRPIGRAQAGEQIELLKKALELDPYLTPAIYKLAFAYVFAGQPAKQRELLDRWSKINPDRPAPTPGPGDTLQKRYGEMGRYATIMNPFPRPDANNPDPPPAPRFEAGRGLAITLSEAERWVKPEDFTGPLAIVGRIRARMGGAIASFDVNRDGRLDLFLASAVIGPKGVRDCLLINQGDGRFVDQTAAFGLPIDTGSVGVAAADFDADRSIDLFLTGVGGNRLWRNLAGKRFEDATNALKGDGSKALSLAARWLDLDQDGDLDLYVINYCAFADSGGAFVAGGQAPAGIANSVYRNDGQPAQLKGSPPPAWAPPAVATDDVESKSGLSLSLVPWPGAKALSGGQALHTAVAALDIDDDRDLDLVLLAEQGPTRVVLNDRLGVFHEAELADLASAAGSSGLLVMDVDSDGRADLAAPRAEGGLLCFRNTTVAGRIAFEPWATNAGRWRQALAIDIDLDGRVDLAGLPAVGKPGEPCLPAWARNEGKRHAAATLPIPLDSPGIEGLCMADLVGDPLPDFVAARPGQPPALARNLGNGQNWLALELGGHWHVQPQLMRTNSHAIGTRLLLEGQGVHYAYDHTTPESGLAQSATTVVIGLGSREKAELMHLRWPDGVMQCELNVTANQKINLYETNRKTGSCPVLFTWNGERFVCVGDFLGGGGMGYLVAPGVYGRPDRDESMEITEQQMKAVGGVYRISVAEPMDEVVYLDFLELDVIDRPPGVSVALDERFAPEGPRPTGERRAFRERIEPARATDLAGRDVTETLRHYDRRTVDGFRLLKGWVGYAEEHGIVLDFGDRLARFGANDPLMLCLAGWVEYPYSQTNYAAATAGIALVPPTLERLRDDGRWEMIEPRAGYPAGLPRRTTLDLTGKLTGPKCVLRIKTNMECYYDQAFIAPRDPAAESALKTTTLSVARTTLEHRGYMRETSPDGGLPLLYAYEYVDPAPLARMGGMLTRYGEVTELLTRDDDRFCVVGPGDEARIEFDGRSVPPIEPGWSRSYVLRGYGYCKDADPCTAGSDTVEPLPWRGMPPFPFDAGVRQPNDRARQEYIRDFQTRPAGGHPPARP